MKKILIIFLSVFISAITFAQKPALADGSLFKVATGTATSTYTGTEIKAYIGSGTGMTAVSVASANGFAGSSSGGSTPALTLSTSITGVLKGNGTALSAATSGTDYSAGTSALSTGILKSTTTTGALTIAIAGDFPTLNQNTTGSAATLTTSRSIHGGTFNGSGDVTNIIASTFGGTGNGFTAFTGPTTAEKTFTLPNASATILTTNAAVTVAQGGTGAATFTAGFLKGNGTSAFTTVATIGNSDLTNSSVTLASGTSGTDVAWGAGSVALGGTATLNIPNAGAAARGVVSTSAQTFAGLKTFQDAVVSTGASGVPAIKASGNIQTAQLDVSSTPVTLTLTTSAVRVDGSAGVRVINLPQCTSGLVGMTYEFTRVDANASNSVTITTNAADTFIGGGTTRLLWGQGTSVVCKCGATTFWDLYW